jgi:PAS domain S-box-containing protein
MPADLPPTPDDRRRAAALSAEAADWFFDNATSVFVIVHDGITTRISPGWTHLLGWSAAEAIGKSIWQFAHPDDLPLVRAAAKEVMRVGQATYDHRVLMKSGEYLWMRVHVKRATDGSGLVVMHEIPAPAP